MTDIWGRIQTIRFYSLLRILRTAIGALGEAEPEDTVLGMGRYHSFADITDL